MKFLFLVFVFFLTEASLADSLIIRKSYLKAPINDGFFSFSVRDGKKRISLRLSKSGDSLIGKTGHGTQIVGSIKNNVIGIFFDDKFLEIKSLNQKIYISKKKELHCPQASQTIVKKNPARLSTSEIRTLDFILGLDRESYNKVSEVWILALIEQLQNTYRKIGVNINFIGTTVFSKAIKSGEIEQALEEYRKVSKSISKKNNADAMIIITSRNLNPDEVLGLAFLGSTCRYEGDFSLGITTFSGKSLQPTLVSHELGHTLNASHTQNGLMKAFIKNPERNFSEVSRVEISDYIEEFGSCLSHQAPEIKVQKRETGFQEISIRNINAPCVLSFYDLVRGNKIDRIERRKALSRKTVSKNSLLKLNNNAKFSLYCE